MLTHVRTLIAVHQDLIIVCTTRNHLARFTTWRDYSHPNITFISASISLPQRGSNRIEIAYMRECYDLFGAL